MFIFTIKGCKVRYSYFLTVERNWLLWKKKRLGEMLSDLFTDNEIGQYIMARELVTVAEKS